MAQRKKKSFDLDAFMKEALSRRVPKEQPLLLRSLDFAQMILNLDPGSGGGKRVSQLSDGLRRADWLYRGICALVATAPKSSKPGRRRKDADLMFVLLMAKALEGASVSFGWRTYNEKRHKEEETAFQRICRLWLSIVDPERTGTLTPHTFAMAKKLFDRRNKNHRP